MAVIAHEFTLLTTPTREIGSGSTRRAQVDPNPHQIDAALSATIKSLPKDAPSGRSGPVPSARPELDSLVDYVKGRLERAIKELDRCIRMHSKGAARLAEACHAEGKAQRVGTGENCSTGRTTSTMALRASRRVGDATASRSAFPFGCSLGTGMIPLNPAATTVDSRGQEFVHVHRQDQPEQHPRVRPA